MTVVGSTSDTRSEACEYRRLTREIERLLAEDRLAEARTLNDSARTLFHKLYGSSVVTQKTDGDVERDDADRH